MHFFLLFCLVWNLIVRGLLLPSLCSVQAWCVCLTVWLRLAALRECQWLSVCRAVKRIRSECILRSRKSSQTWTNQEQHASTSEVQNNPLVCWWTSEKAVWHGSSFLFGSLQSSLIFVALMEISGLILKESGRCLFEPAWGFGAFRRKVLKFYFPPYGNMWFLFQTTANRLGVISVWMNKFMVLLFIVEKRTLSTFSIL